MDHRKKFQTDRDRGSVLVEFAIALPVLVSAMVGIVSLSVSMEQYFAIREATRVAARAAALGADAGEVRDRAQVSAANFLITHNLNPADFRISVREEPIEYKPAGAGAAQSRRTVRVSVARRSGLMGAMLGGRVVPACAFSSFYLDNQTLTGFDAVAAGDTCGS